MTYETLFSEYPAVVQVEDIQNMLCIGRNVAYRILKEGKIKTIKVGKRYIIPKKSVIEFLESAE
jgi:excisionase family DNA binding protein